MNLIKNANLFNFYKECRKQTKFNNQQQIMDKVMNEKYMYSSSLRHTLTSSDLLRPPPTSSVLPPALSSSFRSLLERDISVSSESVRQLADQSLIHLNWFSSQTRRLLLVEDLVDSLKVLQIDRVSSLMFKATVCRIAL